MRIVITQPGDCLIADGINVFIYELSDALIQLGHEVRLMSGLAENVSIGGKMTGYEKAAKEMFGVKNVPNLTVLSHHSYAKTLFTFFFQQNTLFALNGSKIMRKLSPDMAIFNGVTTMWCSCFRVAVSHDMQFRTQILKYYDSLMYRTLDRLVAASTELKQGLIEQLHLSGDNISVIPICADISRFSSRANNERFHAILHVGTRPEKKPDTTIDAFARIAETDSEVKLLIAGQIAPGQLDPWISKIKRQEIRKRVVILGRVSKERLAELYSQVKVTCVPSSYRIPVCSPTAIESLASGTPVVGSLNAITKDILSDGYDGFICKPNDIGMFASRLQMLLNNNSMWENMSRNALSIIRRCDKVSVAKQYLSLYEKFA